MPTYEYRCARDGRFDVIQPVGEANRSVRCPTCSEEGARVFTPPMLSRTPRGLGQATDRAESTRETPDVVASVPPRTAPTPPPAVIRNPALRRLPRP